MDVPQGMSKSGLCGMILLAAVISSCSGRLPYLQPMEDVRVSVDAPVEEICARRLPVLFINTPGDSAVTSKHVWMRCTSLTVVTPQDSCVHAVPYKIKIKGHGNGTWKNYPKKSYTIKFGKPTSLLGIEQGRRYVLLANWRDRTLIRNAVAMKLSSLTSLDWTPDGRFAEVVMNGQLLGTYYVLEKPNIEKDSGGNDCHVRAGRTGHLICLDNGGDPLERDKTATLGTPLAVKRPLGEQLAPGEREMVVSMVDSLERMLVGKAPGDWKGMIDMESFCDWYIVQELTTNIEPRRPRSCYFHFADDGLLHAGPCWDYDYKTFVGRRRTLLDKSAFWYKYMLRDDEFRVCLKSRWNELEPSFRSEIPAFVDSASALVASSEELNHRMWPIIRWHDNGDERMGCAEADERLKRNFLKRLDDLDGIIGDM